MNASIPFPSQQAPSAVIIPVFSYTGLAKCVATATQRASETFDFSEICSAEWIEWYSMTPLERWNESQKLWPTYLALGGSLDPEPDTQSPFYDPEASGQSLAHGRTGLHIIRRGGV